MYWTSVKVGVNMLVDINLLPKKEKKRRTVVFLILLTGIVLLVSGFFFMTTYQAQKTRLVELEQELTLTKELKVAKEKERTQSVESKSVRELTTAIQWVEEHQSSTFFIMRTVSSLLPERGFIVDFSYQEDGAVQLTVRFDSSREAAYYLKSISNSAIISGAKLQTLSTEKLGDGVTAEPILPRYNAQYELTVDKAAIQASIHGEVGS
ncbi:PilN domain-containing protein [Peribacillus sp. NPDC096379]|uniref:PilN domain-containing protein n=1 Tax=Peribacillus sp. NPDC096379 TaxID=3364393 RepID=UPI0037F52B2F